jgi:hypothetical protein
MIYIPKSQIIENQNAKEGELIYAESGIPYSGKYFVIQGLAYAGERPEEGKPLIPLDQPDVNTLAEIQALLGAATGVYSFFKSRMDLVRGIKEKFVPAQPVQAQGEGSSPRQGILFFTQKTNDPNKVIKEIKPNTLNNIIIESLRKDPLYKLVEIDFNSPTTTQQIEEGEKIIPGLKTFINL